MMFTLYRVTVSSVATSHQFQSVLVSAHTVADAWAKAIGYVHREYPEALSVDEVEEICQTPDHVLQWA